MNIGVVTFHRAINIGGALQSYALQYFLKKNGIKSEIIDYRCPAIEQQYYKRPFGWKLLKRFLSALLRNGVIKVNTSKFDQFRSDYLPISKTVFYPETIHTANRDYTAFVTGSDQVWSWYCAGFDQAYFLDFVKKPNTRHAYAASFGGSEIPQDYIPRYQELLDEFESITVRESVGADLVEVMTSQQVPVVNDPTLLLSASTWRKQLIKHSVSRKPFVLVYMIAESKELLKLARDLGKEKKLDIIYINDRVYKPKGIISERGVGPKEFLELVDSCDMFITNSYHGICFSIIFQKDLYIGLLTQNTAVNARIMYMIEKYNLSERLFQSPAFNVNSTINYKHIKNLVSKEAEKSILWLESLMQKE
jgi:hypothetical protein